MFKAIYTNTISSLIFWIGCILMIFHFFNEFLVKSVTVGVVLQDEWFQDEPETIAEASQFFNIFVRCEVRAVYKYRQGIYQHVVRQYVRQLSNSFFHAACNKTLSSYQRIIFFGNIT